MDTQELKGFTNVKDNNKPLYVVLAITVAAIVLGFVFADRAGAYFNVYYLSLLLLIPLFQLFRSRTCQKCNTSMKRFYRLGLPEYYCCEKCKTKIRVNFIVVG